MSKLLLAVAAALCLAGTAQAQNIQYVGQMGTFAFDFCPYGWLPANGALVSTTQYSTLFNLIGTTYGGDGQTNFGVPHAKPQKTTNKLPLTVCVAYLGVFPSKG